MTWAISHAPTRRGTVEHHSSGVARTTIRWPRGLVLVGLTALLLSAWGGIVPFVGPTFGYSANGAPSWHWSALHAWLYLVPGAAGVLVSLALMGRARAGYALARAELAFLGLLLGVAGAWFVVGPSAWPVVHTGGPLVFGTGHTALDSFTYMVGYNLGVGLLLAFLGGMAAKAGIGEREVAAEGPLTSGVAARSATEAPTATTATPSPSAASPQTAPSSVAQPPPPPTAGETGF